MKNGYLQDIVRDVTKAILLRYSLKRVELNKYDLDLSSSETSYYIGDCSRRINELNGYYFKANFGILSNCNLYLTEIENGQSTHICGICGNKVFNNREDAKRLLLDIYKTDFE